MIEPILQVRRLTKTFGGLAAVDNVSLKVNVGELHAVIGPNGAGKTTLINMVSGDLSPSAGSVFGGIEMAHLSPERRSRLGIRQKLSEGQYFCRVQCAGKLPFGSAVARSPSIQLAARSHVLRRSLRKCAARSCRCGPDKSAVIAATLQSWRASANSKSPCRWPPRSATPATGRTLGGPGIGGVFEDGRADPSHCAHAILLVEHDMDAVFQLAQVLTVMVDGKVLASGEPDEVPGR